ncbi:MAG: nitroreductase, partial [Pseudomonadales bacterium]|nr:nitroreductase [Pseudomonadales bacterium]
MDAITALKTRVSRPRLSDRLENPDRLQDVFSAALRAADHAQLRPWRFLVIEGERRTALADLMEAVLAAGSDDDVSDSRREQARAKAFRAPVIVVAICQYREHPKVPQWEQMLSTGAAVQNMLVAAHAIGLGAIWRTGELVVHPVMRQGLKLAGNESIVGFIYLGEPEGE